MSAVIEAVGYVCTGVVGLSLIVVAGFLGSELHARVGWRHLTVADTPDEGAVYRLVAIPVETRERLQTVAEFLSDDIDHFDLADALWSVISAWDTNESTEFATATEKATA